MQRSKQQALMFLLGAVLVGGALGFSADRYIAHDNFASSYGPRSKFYDAIGLTETQRSAMDSLALNRAEHGARDRRIEETRHCQPLRSTSSQHSKPVG